MTKPDLTPLPPGVTARDHRSGSIDGLTLAAYRLLIGRPTLDLAEFATELGCGEGAARDTLDRLVDLGLLQRHGSGTSGEALVTVSPLSAMQRLIARERELLEQRQEFLVQSARTYSSIASAYGQQPGGGGVEDGTELLVGAAAVRSRLHELLTSATTDVLSFRLTGRRFAAVHDVVRALDWDCLGRDVRLRTMYLDHIAFDEEQLQYARGLRGAGADVRLAPELPMNLFIIDDDVALVPRDCRGQCEDVLVIRQPSLVFSLRALFEAHWNQGEPLRAVPHDNPACSSMEQAVLRLLATGAKDDAVARQLGTSVRTVRRVVSTLMERANVSSRFAFGVIATHRGWL